MSSVLPGGFSFPLLKQSEISACLGELGMAVTPQMLSEPTEELVRPVLEKLTELLKGSSRAEMATMDFAGMSVFAYPQLHEESIVEMGMMREILELCTHTGMPDCTLLDVVAPDRARTRRILSALINFAKFREDKLEFFGQFTGQAHALLERRALLEAQADELESRRAVLEKDASRIEAEFASVDEERKVAKNQVVTLAGEFRTASNKSQEVKAEGQALKEQLEQRNASIAATQAEIAKVRAQIVHEPEKLLATLKDMQSQMQSGSLLRASQTAKLKSLQSRLANYSRVEDKLISRKELMESALAEASNVRKLRKNIEEQSLHQKELEATISEHVSTEESLHNSMAEYEERVLSLREDIARELRLTENKMRKAQENQAAVRAEHAARDSLKRQADELRAAKAAEVSRAQAKHKKTMEIMKEKFQRLQEAVARYHHNIKENIDNATNIQQQQQQQNAITA